MKVKKRKSKFPQKKKRRNPSGHGVFFGVLPSGFVVHVHHLRTPEDNNDLITGAEACKKKFRNLSLIIYDRACRLKPKTRAKLDLMLAVDRMHQQKHSKDCSFCEKNSRPIKKRMKAVHNTMAAEQTFSWLRSFVPVLNPLGALRHEYLLLKFVARHNKLVLKKKKLSHLPKLVGAHKKQKSCSYSCQRRKKN